MQHRRACHGNAAGGRPEIFARQVQEHRTAAAGDARGCVVIDFDDEIVQVIVPLEPIAIASEVQPYRPVIVTAFGIFAPAIVRPDRANRQKRARPRMAVRAPPYLPWPEGALRGGSVAFALVGADAATAERDRDGLPRREQPAPAGIAGHRTNPDRRKGPIRPNLETSA